MNYSTDYHISETAPDSLAGEVSRETNQNKSQNPSPLSQKQAQRFEPFPLTDIQYAYWIGRGDFLSNNNVSCHVYPEVDVVNLDINRLNNAISKLIDRHEMLRAVFLPDGRQQIREQVLPYSIKIEDLRDYNPIEAEIRLKEIRNCMSHEVRASDTGLLFEVRASLLDEATTRLHISFDLLIGDGVSFNVLIRDLYHYYLEPERSLPALNISFRDYVINGSDLKDSRTYRNAMNYWQRRIHDLPPAPDLPTAGSPATMKNRRFTRLGLKLEMDKWNFLKSYAAESGLTPAGFLLATFAEVLAVWSKSQDFTINMTLFDRPPVHDQINEIVGDFTTMVLMAVNHNAGRSFELRAREIEERQQRDLMHSQISGVAVLRELSKQFPKNQGIDFPVVFTNMLPYGSRLDNAQAVSLPADLPVRLNYCISQTPQVWLDNQIFEYNGDLFAYWDSVDGLFPGRMLNEMFDAWHDLLNKLATDPASWHKKDVLPIPQSQSSVRKAANDTDVRRADVLLHTLLDKQVGIQPEKEAVVTPDTRISYGELSSRAKAIARILKTHGALPNTLVAIVMEKGWEQVVAAYGVLYSGAAYLPVDASLPRQRRDKILKDGEVRLVLTQSWLADSINWPDGLTVFSVDKTGPADESETLVPVQTSSDLAYVIYTSGSTGDPKGVMIDHKGAVNTILDINKRFHIGREDKIFALVEMSFDLSVYDVFGVLAAGGTVIIPAFKRKNDPENWLDLMNRERVTIWNSVPQPVQLLHECAKNRDSLPGYLRLILMSGDWIPLDLPEKIKSIYPNVDIVGLGGATEASIWSIFYPIKQVDPSWTSIPYGKPLSNQKFYVLNNQFNPCPEWVTGHLYISGTGLAKGYWNDKAKTDKSFIFHPKTNERLYRTGDTGRYLPDGNIEFLGREDSQVKIRGYRIEQGEIEVALKRCSGIQNAVIKTAGNLRGDKHLVAYVVAEDNAQVVPEKLKQALKSILPEYMVPSFFILIDRIPLTANGKIDYRALPKPESVLKEKKNNQHAPFNELEKTVASIIEDILEEEGIGRHDNFFEIGAHSLNIIQIQNRLKETFGDRASSLNLFEHTTINAVTRFLGLGDQTTHPFDRKLDRVNKRKAAMKRRFTS